MNIVNQSNKEKTFYSEVSSKMVDIWALDSLITYVNYNDISIIQESIILDDFRDYLEQEDFIEEIELDKKFYYSPAAFSEFYYGTPDLDFLVLYFSKIPTIFEFNRKKIKVLVPEKLKDINKIILRYKEEVKDSKENPKKISYSTETSNLKDNIKNNS